MAMQFIAVLSLLLLATPRVPAIFADDWRSKSPDVVYGHKAGMALTYDVVRPTPAVNGAAVLFMVSGGWVSSWGPPENFIRAEKGSLNLFVTAMHECDATCELIVMKGAAHGFPGDQGTQAETALLAWFDKYLATSEDAE